MAGRKYTKDELNFIQNNYPKLGIQQTADAIGKTFHAIESKAKRMRLKSEVGSILMAKTRARQSVNLSYFDKLDKYEKGYILGFILADGCMHPKILSTAIEIKDTDKEVLQFIKNEMNLTSNIYYRKNRNMASITIPTKQMSQRLYTLGVHPRKSSTIRMPECKNEEFIRGVVSGYFDGDGGAWLRLKKKSPLIISFTSNSENMLKDISNIIYKNVGIKANVNQNKLTYYCRRSVKVAEWIYKNKENEFHLSRKYKVCQPYIFQ